MIIGSVERPGANSPGAASARHQRRQLGERDRDLLGRILGLIGILGEHDRDRLAHIADPLARQDRLPIGHQLLHPIVAEIDRRDIGEIATGPHRHDAGHRQGLGGLDGADPGMRGRRAEDAHMQLKRKRDIGREQPGPRTSGASSSRVTLAPMMLGGCGMHTSLAAGIGGWHGASLPRPKGSGWGEGVTMFRIASPEPLIYPSPPRGEGARGPASLTELRGHATGSRRCVHAPALLGERTKPTPPPHGRASARPC